MMNLRKKSFLLLTLILVTGLCIFAFLSLHRLLDPELYRTLVQKKLSEVLGREVLIGKATPTFWPGVGMAFEEVSVKDRSQAFDLFRSKRLVLKIRILPVLWGAIQWRSILFEEPIFQLERDETGRFNFIDEPSGEEQQGLAQRKILLGLTTLFGGSVIFQGGRVSIVDEGIAEGPLTTTVEDFNLSLEGMADHRSFRFRVDGKIGHDNQTGRFTAEGTLEGLPKNMDFSKVSIEAEVEMQGVDTSHFWPYLSTWLPMKRVAGILDLSGWYRGDFSGAFKTGAKMRFKDVHFDHPKVFSTLLTSPWVEIEAEVEFDRKDLKVPQFSVTLPELQVKAQAKIYDIGCPSAGMEAEAQTGPFDLGDAKRLIPYRIITPEVSDALFRAEGKGKVQILSVKLSGKMEEIDHCDALSNAHVLSVEMKTDGTHLQLPWNVPALESLTGHLLFKNGHLQLKGVQGKIFRSTIEKANGFIYRLLHESRLQVNVKGDIEMGDIPRMVNLEGFLHSLSAADSDLLASPESLLGRARIELTLDGDLKVPFRFLYQGTCELSKIRYTHKGLPFPIFLGEGTLRLSNDALQWSGTEVEFENSSLLTNGSWRWSEPTGSFDIAARGKVDLKNSLRLFKSSLFPEAFRKKAEDLEGLSGRSEIIFKGQTIKEAPAFHYEGEWIPKDASYHPKGVSSPLNLREGTFKFSDGGVAFSQLRFQSGSSSFMLDGSVGTNQVNLSSVGSVDLNYLSQLLRAPLIPDLVRSQMGGIQEAGGIAEFRLKWFGRGGDGIQLLREGEVKFKGVSLRHRTIPVSFVQCNGFLLVSRDQFRLLGFDGKLGDSPLQGSADISRSPVSAGSKGVRRQLALRVVSSNLNLDPLLPRGEEKAPISFEGLRDWLRQWDLHVKIQGDQGTWRSIFFQDLKVEANTANERLIIRPIYFKSHGGDLWAEGWIEPTEEGVRFEMSPRLANMDSGELIRALFSKGGDERALLTGKVHFPKVELRGEGADLQRIKESLEGHLRLEMEKGAIERGDILAKIFSLLNVSQLFQGRLPDLKTRGLPYQRITANIRVEKGVASTDDLLVDSDAMRITAIGKVDVGKNVIDAKVGVHPLVTLDTVLSHVPIAGYILTGKDRAFVSYLYEVKGSLDDPKIEAVPLKAFGEGVFGIIKRLLETPLMPFQ
jgi:uncharacterized protein YhdP